MASASGRQARRGGSRPPPSMAGSEGGELAHGTPIFCTSKRCRCRGSGGVRVPDLPQPPPHGRGGRQANTILLSFYPFFFIFLADMVQQNQRREKNFTTRKACKKMSACGHQPSCSNRLGESSRLAVFLLFYKEKGFYARTLVTPAGVI